MQMVPQTWHLIMNTGEGKMNIGKDIYLREVEKIRYESLCNSLERYEKRGVKISVQGTSLPVEKCAAIMSVCDYMPDYNFDDLGKIVGINFDRIV